MRYQLLDRGEPVPCTKVDTIEEIIECIKAFDQCYKDMYPDKADCLPYTIGQVK